jgi:Alpha/beta hydrolase of unknown function (DUF900)
MFYAKRVLPTWVVPTFCPHHKSQDFLSQADKVEVDYAITKMNITTIEIPKFIITNYNVARNAVGHIMVDRADGRIRFHAKMGPSDHVLSLYSIRNTGEFFDGAPIYDALPFGHTEVDMTENQGYEVQDPEAPNQPPPHENFDRHCLFYIHGFNSNPDGVFASCETYHRANPHRLVVPVIWADQQHGVPGYLVDKFFNVQPAARAFALVLDYPHAFPQRSLVCHSMGNFLLRRLARAFAELRRDETGFGKQRFDHIFMVAADVTDRLFDRRQNNHKDPTKNDGLNIIGLARRKVHVLYSREDKALMARVVPNLCSCALGLWGYNQDRLHDDAREQLVARDCNGRTNNDQIIHHSYFFGNDQMQYYENTINDDRVVVAAIDEPMFVIVNYNVERDEQGKILVDGNWRVRFHAKMGPSDQALYLYSIRNTGEFFQGAQIYDALLFGQAQGDRPFQGATREQMIQYQENVVQDQGNDAGIPRPPNEEFHRHCLFYIHGLNSKPGDVFESCQTYQGAHRDCMVVPVIWSDQERGICACLSDKLFGLQPAAKAIAHVVNYPDAFRDRSLLCHSRRNFLLRRLNRAFDELKGDDETGFVFPDTVVYAP